ncbi:transcriptional regulator, XRE family [Renibacterium salmoninarum ATCC 33209]|uniref:Transcriptional regulator, XRE family n=2 Tax=Renibacterium salmoninarum TaxID=1646 RepID=A9WN40_RENSM|nr:transcriptional regulator, XRE family [Renibacterium salmoninarum ATCC 33209]
MIAMAENLLGEYLRARRAQVSSETLGLPSHGRRRVPGLRREEVATLAGVSVDYYIRLEQGRERHPSVQVLAALSSVLRLESDAQQHLFRLARIVPTFQPAGSVERVSPELLSLLHMWPNNPALVLGRAYDVLAGNQLAYALFEEFSFGPNLLMQIFLAPEGRSFYSDWHKVAANSVAGFRVLHGEFPEDPRIAEVLQTLLTSSPDFVELWARHDAQGKLLESKRFRHRAVGELTLQMNAFAVKAVPGQELIVYRAAPGSASADALTLLGTLVASAAN